MKYEPCTGDCYSRDDVMQLHTLGLDAQGTAAFLRRLIAMHDPACGNNQIEFRLDVDEFTRSTGASLSTPDRRFVASFYHYGVLDLFAGDTPLEAMNKMIDAALAFYRTADYRELAAKFAAERASVCHHGTDEKLVEFALEFSGLDAAERAKLRAEFAA